MSAVVKSLAGLYTPQTTGGLRHGAEALVAFMQARGTTLQALTLADWQAFDKEIRASSATESSARRRLKGARLYLRVLAGRGEAMPSLLGVLGRHMRQCRQLTSAQRIALEQCKGFRASLVGVSEQTCGHYERGARALLVFLHSRGRRLADINAADWTAFRAAVLDEGPSALFTGGRSARSLLITGARAFLLWKAEQGRLRPDQVWKAPRWSSKPDVALPPGLERLRERMREALEVSGFSASSRRTYPRALRNFLVWLDAQGITEPVSITRDVMTAYLLHVQKTPSARGGVYALSTQTGILAALRFLFSWLVKTGVLLADPTIHLRYPRQGLRLPRPIKVAEAGRLLRAVKPTPLGRRDRAMVELLYGTGLRRAELCKLVLSDVNLEERTLLVREGKGRKDRVVPFGKKAKDALVEYLDRARETFVRRPTDVVFLTRSGRALPANYLTILVRRMGERIGLKVSPHRLRHSCATHLLKGRADIRQIQRLLGHASLATTEKYTKIEVGDLQEVIRRCHPREKGRV